MHVNPRASIDYIMIIFGQVFMHALSNFEYTKETTDCDTVHVKVGSQGLAIDSEVAYG